MEHNVREGDDPVSEIVLISVGEEPLSTTEHEKFCWKLRRPLRKAKYYLFTDSEPVP